AFCQISALSGPSAEVMEAADEDPSISRLALQLQRLLQHRLRARAFPQPHDIDRQLAQGAGDALFVPKLPEQRQALLVTGSRRHRAFTPTAPLTQIDHRLRHAPPLLPSPIEPDALLQMPLRERLLAL